MAKLTFKGQDAGAEEPAPKAKPEKNERRRSRKEGRAPKQKERGPEARSSRHADIHEGEDAAAKAVARAKRDSRRRKSIEPRPEDSAEHINFHAGDMVNPYASQQKDRHGMDPRLRSIIIIAIVTVIVFFLSATLPTEIFAKSRMDSSFSGLIREWQGSFSGFFAFFMGADTMYSTYIWTVVVAALAGAGLALSGAVFQGALKNSLAGPSTLGVTNGATLGIIIYGVFLYQGEFTGDMEEYSDYLSGLDPLSYFVANFGQYLSSVIGCIVVVSIVLIIAFIAGRGHVSNISVIIAGQVLATVITVIINWIRYYLTNYSHNTELVNLLNTYQTSTFTGAYTLTSVAMFAIPLIICFVVIFATGPRMSLLAFDSDEARTMGIDTGKTRFLVVAICTVMIGLIVSFCGAVGFVGFIVPHIMRKLVGPDFRYLLPASALGGAVLVCGVHYLCFLGIPGIQTDSTGIFTSIIGCIMFLTMALKQRRHANADWY